MTNDPTCDGVIAFGQMGGEQAAVLLSPIADSAPEDVRERLARRNMGHRCPNVTVEHETECPATTANLRAAIARLQS